MLTNVGVIWVIIELLIGSQMLYYVVFDAGNRYMITTILYWIWLGIYVWNPSNIFYMSNRRTKTK